MYPTAILLEFGLLVKGSLERDFLRAPINALWKHILLPSAAVCFFAFLDTGATGRTVWPMIAVAGAIWLLFANCVNYAGMVLWRERWLLRQSVVPAWLLVGAAAAVPIGLFGVHLSLIHLALLATSFPGGRVSIDTLVAGSIAATFGLGAGILAARFTGFRPGFVSALPKLLLVSLVLTPVLYRPSALDGLKDAWCVANPLCVAMELARADISQSEPLAQHAKAVTCAVSAAILCWGLFTLRVPSPWFADDHA